MSICPKNKSSKGRRDRRRANWKMSAPNLVKCSKCGELMMSHRVCKNCGTYNKKRECPGAQRAGAFLWPDMRRIFQRGGCLRCGGPYGQNND